MRQHQRRGSSYFGGRGRLYRSTRDSVFAGVCGGIAEHFDLSAWAVRFVFLLLQFTVAPWLFIAYLILMFVLKKTPPEQFAGETEQEFWNTYQSSRSEALNKVKRAFDQLDRRIQRMEEAVTRPEYDLEDEYRKL